MNWMLYIGAFCWGMAAQAFLSLMFDRYRHRRRMSYIRSMQVDLMATLAMSELLDKKLDHLIEPYPNYFADLDHRNNTH